MKKFILVLVAVLSGMVSAKADVFSGTYNFNSNNGNASSVSGASFSAIASRGSTPVTTTFTASRLNTSGWPPGTGISTPGTYNANQYVGFTVTPTTSGWNNYQVSLNIAFNARINTLSPYSNGAFVQIGLYQNGTLVSSVQQFHVNSTSMSGFSFAATGEFTSASPIEIRISAVNGSAQGQTVSFDDMVISGETTLVPEPTNIALGIVGLSFGGVFLRRKLRKNKELTAAKV